MKKRGFSEEEKRKIVKLIAQGKTNPEIALIMSRSRASIAMLVGKFMGGNPNYMKRKTIHKHLRGPVMEYFLTHTSEETIKRFKLTKSNFKSIMTVGYRTLEFNHLRKDTRRRDFFSEKELVTLLRLSGIVNRKRIAEIIKRDNERVIKEKLAHLKIASRNINGMNISLFRNTFKMDPPRSMKTLAGPPRRQNDSHFRMVFWTDIELWMSSGTIPSHSLMLKYVGTMAMFQRWIWGTDKVPEKAARFLNKEKRLLRE